MNLTKATGNMYKWVTHVWSPIKGCKHDCPYCYVKSMKARYGLDDTIRIDEKELMQPLGKKRKIFVGHLSDMWGTWVPDEWIQAVITRCLFYPGNEYYFQSKNPGRFRDFKPEENFFYGTTIETDEYPKSFWKFVAPSPRVRAVIMQGLSRDRKRFVTIEPIMDFNLFNLIGLIKMVHPMFVTIGADSKGHKLKEPPWEKVQELIDELQKFTEIRQKTNLERLRRK